MREVEEAKEHETVSAERFFESNFNGFIDEKSSVDSHQVVCLNSLVGIRR